MKRILLSAAAVAFATSFAVAQNAPGNGDPAWDDDINGTFYSDTAAGTMRTQDDVKTRWMSLSADKQAQVKADCAAMEGKNVGAGNGSGAADATAGATGANDGAVNIQTICGWAKAM